MSEKDVGSVLATFKVQGLDSSNGEQGTGKSQKLHVLSFEAEEEISRLFSVNLVLAAEDDDIPLTEVVGSNGLLTLASDWCVRHFHGVVSSFERRQRGRKLTVYIATLVPRIWRLEHRSNCRIFQEKDVQQIVEEVLQKTGVKVSFTLRGDQVLRKREYCVQYRESDWAFISRLLEDEGLFFYFEHTADSHTLRVGRDAQVYRKVPAGKAEQEKEGEMLFRGPQATLPGLPHIRQLSFSARIRTDTVTLDEYDFLKPTYELRASEVVAENELDLELFDYPGKYQTQKQGAELAKIRLEEVRMQRLLGEGRSDTVRLIPGHTFTLTGYDAESLDNKAYLVTHVRHHGEGAADLETASLDGRCSYDNTFACIPKEVAFRPQRITPVPVIHSVQTAVVVGPKKEDIYTDEHGRVKVLFHWDRKAQDLLTNPQTLDQEQVTQYMSVKEVDLSRASCWIRVSQLWAGEGWGAMWIPRVGQEVVVSFEEGDPDRPLITGRVYHALNLPPYGLPGHKTRSTIKSNSTPEGKGSRGFNELRFEDKKGAEEIYIHAQKEMNEVVLNNHTVLVKKDETETVEGNRSVTVTENETLNVSKGDRLVAVLSGDDTHNVMAGKRSVMVQKNDELNVIQGDRKIVVAKGFEYHEVAEGDRRITLAGGSEHRKIAYDRFTSIERDDKCIVASGDKETCVKAGKMLLSCGESFIEISKTGNVTIKGNGGRIEISPTGVTINGITVDIN